MKCLEYEIKKNVEKILRGDVTGFLANNLRVEVQNRLKRNSYQVFMPFKEAEKVILYPTGKVPKVRLFEICAYKDDVLKHSAIMGSLFGLNITSEMFGDIVKLNDSFYVYLIDSICDLVLDEFRMAGNVPIRLKEVSNDLLNNFEREYERYEVIVSSLRIDTVISRLIHCNRDFVEEKIRNQEIIVNDTVIKKSSSSIKGGDIFSIRGYGKYRFTEIAGRTKKDNFIIEIDKYI